MQNLDPDILAVLQNALNDEESARIFSMREKHKRQSIDRWETQLELLADELERVVPRSHPMFIPMLIVVAIRKLERQQQPDEFKSYLNDGFPPSW